MAAVISGGGLGLFDSSLASMQGVQVGQGRNTQYVNIATGNLVLQSVDEHMLFRGLEIAQARTYNSLGTLGGSGADGWVTGFERRVELVSGAFDTAGSVMRRHTGDGGWQDFAWIAPGVYASEAGDGADDTLRFDAGTQTWTWREGSTLREEDYGQAGTLSNRLLRIRDAKSGSQWTVAWSNDRIYRLEAGNDVLAFEYDALTGNLAAVTTSEAGVALSRVSYGYDTQGRLTSITTDLTPADTSDNAATGNLDGRLYVTTYAYVGTSLQISSVTQSDGTAVAYTYYPDGRLATVGRGNELLTYIYDTNATKVRDALQREWAYTFDANGRLTSSTSPQVDGLTDVTTYTYDGDNITRTQVTRGAAIVSQVDMRYDASGNLLWQWDGLGNAVQRTYDANNQLLDETRYTGVDPDREGAALPTGGLTTRHVYDANERVRFIVDATGAVTELEYAASGNGIGQQNAQRRYAAAYAGTVDLASLVAWSAGQKTDGTLTTLDYDVWGRLQQTTSFATLDAGGNGVTDAATSMTHYSYDIHGLLRQQFTFRGIARDVGSEVVDYVYDGMGRLLQVIRRDESVVAANDPQYDAKTLTTTYAWLDSSHRLDITTDAGATRTELRDSAGRLVSSTLSSTVTGSPAARTTQYFYDAAGQLRATQDAAGNRSYVFYDTKGRVEATVDATGAVTHLVYDGADRLVSTTAHAVRVDTSTWLDGNGAVANTTFASIGVATNANDRTATREYDAAGRLVREVDGEGGVVRYAYDGIGQLVRTTRSDAAETAATAHVTRLFYDAAGRLLATLDAEGFLTETMYDGLGRAVATTRYANATPTAQRAAGTLDQLRPSTNAAQDQVTRAWYDRRGNLVASLDAEGYLVEFVFDEAGNQRAEQRYATKVAWSAGVALATLRTQAGAMRESRTTFNAFGQRVTQTNFEGTVTRFTYDADGRLVKTAVADATSEVREAHLRYNVFDEVIGELTGEAAVRAIAANPGFPALSETALDTVYQAFGTRHAYDALGRRIETIDALGNKTWIFHNDTLGRTYTARAIAEDNNGTTIAPNKYIEITESRTNAFGETIETIAYTGRFLLASPGTRASAQSVIDTLPVVGATDSRRTFAFDRRGLLTQFTDAVGTVTKYGHDAFGQRTLEQRGFGSAAQVDTLVAFDKRGLATSITEGYGTTIARTTNNVYDAFGRLVSSTDPRNATTSFAYDRRGRLLTTTGVLGRTVSTTWDAFDRVLTTTDAESAVTTYAYDDAAKEMTVTTPEGVKVTTKHDAFGDTVSVKQHDTAGKVYGTTTYTFDDDGHLVSTTDAAGKVATNSYDKRGLLSRTTDASGRVVQLNYDAAGRVLSRVEDPDGTPRTTTYVYDAQGRQVKVTDPSGRATAYTYDREGRIALVSVDPNGLALRTSYTYDALGRQVTVIVGSGTGSATTTTFEYDALGRRTKETLDPSGVNAITRYAYDANDNVIRRTDANGAITRFTYDSANRLVHTIDALGTITRNWYDPSDRVVAVRTFGHRLDPALLSDATTAADIDASYLDWDITNYPVQGEYRVYDNDGRLAFSITIAGTVTQYFYDGANRVSSVRRYAASSWGAIDELPQGILFGGTTLPSMIDVADIANDTLDEVTWNLYDAAGRLQATVDGTGSVAQFYYDEAGRLVATRRYADEADIATLRSTLDARTATLASVLASVAANTAYDEVAYQVYDAAGRLKYTLDAAGGMRETYYDAAGRVVGSRAYANVVSLAAVRTKLETGDESVIGTLDDIVATSNDVATYVVYDSAGRATHSVDAAGFVVETTYDAAGRATTETRYANAATITSLVGALKGGTATGASLELQLQPNADADRQQVRVFDLAGRVRFVLTRINGSQFAVSERQYDALGQVISETTYAVAIPDSTTTSVAAVATAIGTAGGNAADKQRITRFAYDVNGHLRYSIDDANVVTEQRWDSLGRMVQVVTTGTAIAGTVANNEAAIKAAVDALPAATKRTTTMAYDSASRLTKVTDALGNFETFSYDMLGRKTAYVDKTGARWDYTYDASGRLVSERSPLVSVTSVGTTGVAAAPASRNIITTFVYDALGNLEARNEDAGAGGTVRTTTYAYDSRGNLVTTTFPDAWQVNDSGTLVVTGATVNETLSYDAFNRVIVRKDTRGNYSHVVYDVRGQVAFEIDQEGGVTGYAYDGFGQQVQLVRYDTAIAVPGSTPSQLASVAAAVGTIGAGDRTLTMQYDQQGNKIAVTQSASTYVDKANAIRTGSPTTYFEYDLFGNLVKERVLLDQQYGVYATTFHYYDQLGRKTLTVDAEGYVTAWEYNARGEVETQVEFARAVNTASLTTTVAPGWPVAGDSTTGYDRVMEWTYDALGRKVTEVAQRQYQRIDTQSGLRDVVTEFAYDAEDRITQTKVDGVVTSKLAYDAMGRTTSVTEAARQVLVSNWQALLSGNAALDLSSASLYSMASPYTKMEYDAFGNAVVVSRYAKGAVNGVATATPGADSVTTTLYDRQGRAVLTTDAMGEKWFSRYDAADNLVKTWYDLSNSAGTTVRIVTDATYSASGRQLTSDTTRNGVRETSTSARYNVFGEITAQGNIGADLNNSVVAAQYTYDANGKLLTSTADNGEMRTYRYNLAGHQIREERSGGATYSQTVDKLGRVIRQELPAYDAAGTKPFVTMRLDRWGNVLEQVDPRGFVTKFRYNDRNQVVQQVAPLVWVLDAQGNGAWRNPTSYWMYDALGRLIGTQDANGNTDAYDYDAAGQRIASTDAMNSKSLQAYDALGRNVANQDAARYITWVDYDRLDRAVAQGDYFTSSSRTKVRLQSFTLNENGDRVRVYDALNDPATQGTKYAAYDYDSRHLLVMSKSAAGVTRTSTYDQQGHKVTDADALATNTWTYDYYGRVSSHTDLGGYLTTYAYDATTGLLATTTIKNATGTIVSNRTSTYFANGQLKHIGDSVTGETFDYEYDAAGNRTREQLKVKDGQNVWTNSVTQTIYDSHGRISRVTTDDVTVPATPVRKLDLVYDYDAVGNRRRVIANSGYGTNTAPITIDNRAPVVIQPPAAVSLKGGGGTVSWRVPASDVFRDPEGKPLSYSASVTPAAAWLTFAYDAAAGEFVFTATPPAGTATYNVNVIASDGGYNGQAAQQVSQAFAVNVVANTVPVPKSTATAQVKLKTGEEFSCELRATDFFNDPDVGETLQLALLGTIPNWLSVTSPAAGVLRLSGIAPIGATTVSLNLRATDSSGAYATKALSVIVQQKQPPVATAGTMTVQVVQGRTFGFERTLSQLFSDANNDALQISATLAGGAPLPSWLTVQYLAEDNPPTLRVTGEVPAGQADVSVVLTATDVDGMTATKTLLLDTVTNTAPTIAQQIGPITARIGTNFNATYSFANCFNDAQGDALTYQYIGSSQPWLVFTTNAQGQFTLAGTPPVGATLGTTTVTLRATDPSGATALMTISVTVQSANVAPTVTNPIPDQVPTPSQAWSYMFPSNTFTDGNNDPMTYTTSALPSWLTFNANTRTFSGTPTTAGTWTITVTAKDSWNYTGSDTFTITVPNISPVWTNNPAITNQSAVAGQQWTWQVPASAIYDQNGDTLTWMAEGWQRYVEYDPDLGHVSYWDVGPLPSWLTFNSATRTFTGTPPAIATTELVLSVYDNHNGSSTQLHFNLVATAAPNYPPTVVNAIPNQTAPANGAAWAYTVPANTFSDTDALTWSAANLPPGMSFNATTHQITGTPYAAGSYTVTITATDTASQSVSTTFVITTPNVAPRVVTPIPDMGATINTAWSYAFPTNTFGDYNTNQTLTYTVITKPAWMTFTPGTRTFSGTPTATGANTVTVQASDGALTITDTFVVTVGANLPPVVSNPLLDINGNDVYYTFAANTFTDPNGDVLTYTTSALPAGLTFTSSNRTFSGYVSGGRGGKTFTITVTASDNRGGTVSDTLTLYAPADTNPYGLAATDTTTNDKKSLKKTKTDAETAVLADGGGATTMAVIIDDGGDTGGGGGGGGGGTGGGGTNPPPTPPPAGTVERREELWFSYDKENRVQIVNGKLDATTHQIMLADSKSSYALEYDVVGNAVSRTYRKQDTATQAWSTKFAISAYDERHELVVEQQAVDINADGSQGAYKGIKTRHYYNANGQEIELRNYFALGTTRTWRTGNPNYADTEWYTVNVGGWLSSSTQTQYDADGRVWEVNERGRVANFEAGFEEEPSNPIVVAQTTQIASLTLFSNVLYHTGATSYYDAAGRLTQYKYEHVNGPTEPYPPRVYTHTYTFAYIARDSWLEDTVSGVSTDTNFKAATTDSNYNALGQRISIRETAALANYPDRLRYYAYDGENHIVSRVDGTAAKDKNHFTYANGQQVARLAEDGTMDVSSQLTGFDSSEAGSEPTTVQDGDTLQSIAQRVYGNESLWYVLAEANALSASDELVAGTTLKAPEVKTTLNDFRTFKPYNPGEIIGPTSPSLPYVYPPSARAACDTLAMVIRIFVTVVVTMATSGGGTAAAWGAMGWAAMGEYAAQAVEVQDGYREDINWGQVGVSGAMAGFTASGTKFAEWGAKGWRAAVYSATMSSATYLATYAINKALGEEAHFNLRTMTAGAATAALSSFASEGIGGDFSPKSNAGFDWGQVAASTVQSLAGDVLGVGVQKAFGLDAAWSWRNAARNMGESVAKTSARMLVSHPSAIAEPFESDSVEASSGLYGEGWYPGAELFDPNYKPDWLYADGAQDTVGSYGMSARSAITYADRSRMPPPSDRSPGEPVTWDQAAYATDYTHDYWWGDLWRNSVPQFDSSWSYDQKKKWFDQKNAAHDLLPPHHDDIADVRVFGTGSDPGSMRYMFGLTDEQTDAAIASGETTTMDAVSYAARSTAYKVGNFIALGFWERNDNRLDAWYQGRITENQYWTGTAVDAVTSVASAYVGGRAGGYVLGRMGTGYGGVIASGAVVGGTMDGINQLGDRVQYALTDGALGSEAFSWERLVGATVFGAATGGAIKYLEGRPILSMEVGDAFANSYQRLQSALGRAGEASGGIRAYFSEMAQGNTVVFRGVLRDPNRLNANIPVDNLQTPFVTIRNVTSAMRTRMRSTDYLDPFTNTRLPVGNQTMAVDHQVPVNEIIHLPGFNKLTPRQMRAIIHDDMNLGNLEPMPLHLNSSKGAKFGPNGELGPNGKPLAWTHYDDTPLSPDYLNDLHTRQIETLARIEKQIRTFLKANRTP